MLCRVLLILMGDTPFSKQKQSVLGMGAGVRGGEVGGGAERKRRRETVTGM